MFMFRHALAGDDTETFDVLDQTLVREAPPAWGSEVNAFLSAEGAERADGVFLLCLADIEFEGDPPREHIIVVELDIAANHIESHALSLRHFRPVARVETFEHLPSLMQCLHLTPH